MRARLCHPMAHRHSGTWRGKTARARHTRGNAAGARGGGAGRSHAVPPPRAHAPVCLPVVATAALPISARLSREPPSYRAVARHTDRSCHWLGPPPLSGGSRIISIRSDPAERGHCGRGPRTSVIDLWIVMMPAPPTADSTVGLSNEQWALVAHLFHTERTHGGRYPTHSRRAILAAVLHLMDTACPWRQLPAQYPPWRTVYGYYRRWDADGTLQQVQAARAGSLFATTLIAMNMLRNERAAVTAGTHPGSRKEVLPAGPSRPDWRARCSVRTACRRSATDGPGRPPLPFRSGRCGAWR
ncbi:MAG: transposase [Jatrophihabitans sp.]